MTAEYEEEKEAFSKLNDVASRVRSQGRYVNRLAELTGAVKNGDQCGKFKKNSLKKVQKDFTFMLSIWWSNSEIQVRRTQSKKDDIVNYRDRRYENFYTGRLASENEIKWIDDREP